MPRLVGAPAPGVMTLPERLGQLAAERRRALKAARVPLPRNREHLAAVLIGSNFFYEQLCKRPAAWAQLVHEGALDARAGAHRFSGPLQSVLDDCTDRGQFMRALREFKAREAMRLIWRDLSGQADLEETMQDTSSLADACIQAALDWAGRQLRARFGTPLDAGGQAMQMLVLGMGKLGAEELNFSSDVDLIFAYAAQDATDHARSRPAQEFFQRLARELVQLLDEANADGYVYRVDLRLRPHGDAGRLVLSQAAMEEYFQREGRDWERYAWIKARPVAGDLAFGHELVAQLRPFVYRRYLDWSALEALRDLKSQVERDVRRRRLQDDIKQGPGGIREIEFIAQVFQLIRGGRDPALRDRRLITTLERLAERQTLTPAASAELIQAYVFLRRLENRLQMLDDSQTHRLPRDSLAQARIAWTMGYADWPAFQTALEEVRARVHGHFRAVFREPPAVRPQADESALRAWSGEPDAMAALAHLGFEEPRRARRALEQFRHGARVRAMDARERRRLDGLMPYLLAAMKACAPADHALPRLLGVLEAISRRSVYLAMLFENPPLAERLCRLCGMSGWLAREVARAPVLLDELLNPAGTFMDQGDAVIQAELRRALGAAGRGDPEASLAALVEFKRAGSFQVALSELADRCDAAQAGGQLSALARTVVAAALQLAAHGRPAGDLAVVAYGRLGAGELSFDSDLDLVFLYEGDAAGSQGGDYARLVRRLMHLLTTPTAAGRLYPVDTRLRPNGQAGLLVSPLDAYRHYQMHEAWTWELQALVRAQCVIGNSGLREAFNRIRRDALTRPRDARAVRDEIAQMRARMRRETPSGDDLKHGAGGLVDVAFLVQYFVLAHAAECPELVRSSGTLAHLRELGRARIIDADQAQTLADAYRLLLQAEHRRTLAVSGKGETELAAARAAAAVIYRKCFGA